MQQQTAFHVGHTACCNEKASNGRSYSVALWEQELQWLVTQQENRYEKCSVEDINHNAECFKRQMSKFIEFGEGKL